MSVWRYSAVDLRSPHRARRTTGELVAETAAEVRSSLRRVGLQVVDLRVLRDSVGSGERQVSALLELLHELLRNRRRPDLREVYDGLSTMLESGLPLVEALDTLIEGDTATSTLGDPATLELRSDGTVSASTGCRELPGEYVVNGSEIIVTNAEMSGECPAELESQDDLVVTVITDGFTTEIEGNRLTLASQGGDGLSYTSEVEG